MLFKFKKKKKWSSVYLVLSIRLSIKFVTKMKT